MDSRYLSIGSRIKHPEFGDGVVIQVKSQTFLITFISVGIKEISRNFNAFEIIDGTEPPEDMLSFAEVEKTLINVLRKFSDLHEKVDLAPKYQGGMLIIKAADPSLKPKEVPIDVFFNKIVMLRDRLRVLEQRINAHEKLSEEEKVNMQQYITRCYGSLTTFNILFKSQDDHFVGDKSN